MGALIAFGVVGGALAGGLALAPMAIAGVVDSSTARLETWVENLPPATEQKLSRLMHGEKDCAGGAAVPLAPRPDR
jgi:hypothetical protein